MGKRVINGRGNGEDSGAKKKYIVLLFGLEENGEENLTDLVVNEVIKSHEVSS